MKMHCRAEASNKKIFVAPRKKEEEKCNTKNYVRVAHSMHGGEWERENEWNKVNICAQKRRRRRWSVERWFIGL